MPAQYAIQEDNSRYWDDAPIYCINAGTECQPGTLAHGDSEGQCCARCEADSYLEESWRTLSSMCKAVTVPGDEFDSLKRLHDHELAMANHWLEIARKDRVH